MKTIAGQWLYMSFRSSDSASISKNQLLARAHSCEQCSSSFRNTILARTLVINYEKKEQQLLDDRLAKQVHFYCDYNRKTFHYACQVVQLIQRNRQGQQQQNAKKYFQKFTCCVFPKHIFSSFYQEFNIFFKLPLQMDKTELIYDNFSMNRIEEIVQLVVQSFSTNNPFLTNGAQTPQALRKRSTQRIQFYYAAMNSLNKDKGSNYQLMKVLIYKGQVVAFAMVCQLHRMIDYRLPTAQPGSISAIALEFFSKKSYHENQVLFGSLLAVHKDYMKYKLSIFLLQKAFKQWGSYGFKSVAGISNNPISLKVFQSFGAKVVKVIKVNENGKELSMYLIINDLADVVWPKL